MQSFTTLTSKMIPLPHKDVDTDQIIPARYLKVTDKAGLVDGLFYEWRYQADGSLNKDFPLNQSQYQGTQILLAGDNFGCGSSREHAPWALTGWGLRSIISTSFADIFQNNALKNGLLPVVVDAVMLDRLFGFCAQKPDIEITLDLPSQTLSLPDGNRVHFEIDPFSKLCLIEGVDPLGYLLKQADKISAYETSHPSLLAGGA